MSTKKEEVCEPKDLMLLSHLLKMADDYHCNGSVEQARELYFELAERDADSVEGMQARERLVEIAEEYEQQGLLHQARGVYERLHGKEKKAG